MRVLVGEIVGGTLKPGDRLPREADLAEQFEVSRGVARETIRGLEERGLVTVKHGRGATVNPPQQWDTLDPDVLIAVLGGDNGGAFLTDYLECRRVLESEAAALAAARATEADLAELRAAFNVMRDSAARADSTPAAEQLYREADIAFHRAVVNATENKVLGQMTEPLHRALAAALEPLARPEHRFERGLPEHERILDAIGERDPDAAREAMLAHLNTIGEYLGEYQTEKRKRRRKSSGRRVPA